MHMEEHPPKSAAYGSGRMGTPVITLTEWVEPSSFAAVGDRLLEQFFSVMHALDPIRSRQKDQTKPFWLSKYYWRTLNFWSVNFAMECNISFSSVACERTLLATSSVWLDHSFDIVWSRLVVGPLGQTSDQPADLHFGALTLSTGCTNWNGNASHLRFVLKCECNQANWLRGKSCWTIVHVRTSDWSHAASSKKMTWFGQSWKSLSQRLRRMQTWRINYRRRKMTSACFPNHVADKTSRWWWTTTEW